MAIDASRSKSAVLGGWLLFSAVLCAQEPDPQEPPPSHTGEYEVLAQDWTLDARVGSTYVIGGDLDGVSDEVDLWKNRLDMTLTGPLWPGSQLTVGTFYEHRHYDFSGTNTFLAGTSTPFEDVNALGLSATFFQGLTRSWTPDYSRLC